MDWLTKELVERWLPAVLRVSDSDASRTVLEQAAEHFPAETQVALLQAVARELRSGEAHAFTLSRAPGTAWKAGLGKAVVSLVQQTQPNAAAKAEVLLAIAAQERELAVMLAQLWLAEEGNEVSLRTAAVRVLLAAEPEAGLAELEALAKRYGQEVILDVAASFGRYGTTLVQPEGWPEVLQERLALLLFEQFPKGSLPVRQAGQAYYVTPEDEIVELRWRLLNSLMRSQTVFAHEALQRLAAHEPWILEQLAQDNAEMAARAVIAQAGAEQAPKRLAPTAATAREKMVQFTSGPVPPVGPTPDAGGSGQAPRGPRRIPWRMLLRILDAPNYRLALTCADLSRALVEVLRQIGETLPDDFRLLYRPPGWAKPAQEEVLQAYLRVRLGDLLPGYIVDREAWAPLNKRADLRVMVTHQTLATRSINYIEVKWSHDKSAEVAPTRQLGAKYLIPTRTSHGILVVAWCGKAKNMATSRADLEATIRKDVEAFQTGNPGHFLEVVYLDCAPPHTASAPRRSATVRAGPAQRRQRAALKKEEAGRRRLHRR